MNRSTTATLTLVGNDTSSTVGPDNNICIILRATDIMTDVLLLKMVQSLKKAEEEARIPIKPTFDRVMKMRNTDGRPIRYSTWKPVRMYDGRGNIGTRNFAKLN